MLRTARLQQNTSTIYDYVFGNCPMAFGLALNHQVKRRCGAFDNNAVTVGSSITSQCPRGMSRYQEVPPLMPHVPIIFDALAVLLAKDLLPHPVHAIQHCHNGRTNSRLVAADITGRAIKPQAFVENLLSLPKTKLRQFTY